MSRSHVQVYVHYVWATWDRQPLIAWEARDRMYAVLRAACERKGCEVLALGGMPDHVHLLVALPPTVSVAEVAHDVKGASSRWVNQARPDDGFRWQGRYGAFSVSPGDRRRVIEYIRNQEWHHAEGTVWERAEEIPETDTDD